MQVSGCDSAATVRLWERVDIFGPWDLGSLRLLEFLGLQGLECCALPFYAGIKADRAS